MIGKKKKKLPDEDVSQKNIFKFEISTVLLTHKFFLCVFFLGYFRKKKRQTIAKCLTEEWEEDWKVVRHDKEVDTCESGAGFKVTERLAQVVLLPAAADKHLRTKGER